MAEQPLLKIEPQYFPEFKDEIAKAAEHQRLLREKELAALTKQEADKITHSWVHLDPTGSEQSE